MSETVPRQRRRFIQMHKELISEDYAFVAYDVGRFTNCLCGMKITRNYIFENVQKKEVVLGSTCARRYRALKAVPEKNRQAIQLAERIVENWDRFVKRSGAPSEIPYDVMRRAFLLEVKRLNSALLYVGNIAKFVESLSKREKLLTQFEKAVLKTVRGYVKEKRNPTLKQFRVLVNADLRLGDLELLNAVSVKSPFVQSLRDWVKRRPLTWKQLRSLERVIQRPSVS